MNVKGMNTYIKNTLRVVFTVYFGFGLILFLFQKRFVYFPDNQDFNSCSSFLESEKLDLNGTRVYYRENGFKNLLILYHGNAGSACDRSFWKKYLESLNFSYLVVEYAGYSNDKRMPSKELLLKDVENVNEFTMGKNFENIVVAGESLGTSMAAYHSTLTSVNKLLLISPFYSLNDIAMRDYWMYPIPLLFTENFNTGAWMKKTKAIKIEILHGVLDEIVPLQNSKKLFDNIETNEKKFIEVDGAHHNDIYNFNKTSENIRRFLSE